MYLVALLRDLQAVELRHGLREAFDVAGVINAADAQGGDAVPIDDKRVFAVAIYLGDGVRQWRVVEHHFTPAPGGHGIHARGIDFGRRTLGDAHALAGCHGVT